MRARIWLGVALLAAFSGSLGCRHQGAAAAAAPAAGAYDTETDWTDGQRIISLGYEEAQGKHIFYQQCVWCHADATPAGPSNRSNLTPVAPLLNDGSTLNAQSDETLQKIVTQGGAAVGKSAMMPPYGRMLSAEDIRALVAFARAIAQPPYPAGSAAAQDARSK